MIHGAIALLVNPIINFSVHVIKTFIGSKQAVPERLHMVIGGHGTSSRWFRSVPDNDTSGGLAGRSVDQTLFPTSREVGAGGRCGGVGTQ